MFSFARRSSRPGPANTNLFVPRVEGLECRTNPTPVGIGDTYSVAKGSVLTRPVDSGVLANDFDNEDSGAVLTAILIQGAQYSNPNVPPLPNGSLRLFPNGSFTFIAPSNYQTSNGSVTFTYQTLNVDTGKLAATPTTVTINIAGSTGGAKFFAVGTGSGVASEVRVFSASTGAEKYVIHPYEASFLGGVRVATGDLNGDGTDDIAVAPANGGGARIQVYDGQFGTKLEDFFAFEPSFRGGADVAIGQMLGQKAPDTLDRNDLIVGAGEGGGPRIKVFDGVFVQNLSSVNTKLATTLGASAPFLDFFAYETTFRNGVRVAAGDLGNDSSEPTILSDTPRDFIVTGAGFGGGPVVKVFDPQFVANNLSIGLFSPAPVRAFNAFDPAGRGGVTVAVGQFRGDGLGDIVAGAGTGSPTVRVFNGRSTAFLREFTLATSEAPFGQSTGNGNSSSSLFGQPSAGGSPSSLITTGNSGNTGGARVGVTDRVSGTTDTFPISEIIAAPGFGSAPRVRIYDGNSLQEVSNFTAFDTTNLGGVFVGGNSL